MRYIQAVRSQRTGLLENEGVIRPALKKQNLALGVWLASKRDEDRRLYLKEKRELQRLIRKLKNQCMVLKQSR